MDHRDAVVLALGHGERERLEALVKVATSAPAEAAFPTDEAALEQALLSLREWYVEWSEIARLVIRRRDHLITLGLASRRSGGGSTDEMDVVDPTPFVTTTRRRSSRTRRSQRPF